MLINPFFAKFQWMRSIGLSLLILSFSAAVSANNGRISFEHFRLKATSEQHYVVNTQLRFN